LLLREYRVHVDHCIKESTHVQLYQEAYSGVIRENMWVNTEEKEFHRESPVIISTTDTQTIRAKFMKGVQGFDLCNIYQSSFGAMFIMHKD
jgi:hypothetical protein